MKKVVGKVTDEEKSVIKEINDHRVSLEELLLVLPKDDEFYQIALDDMAETMKKYQQWWDDCYNKYQWEKGDGEWKIMFETNEIIKL